MQQPSTWPTEWGEADSSAISEFYKVGVGFKLPTKPTEGERFLYSAVHRIARAPASVLKEL